MEISVLLREVPNAVFIMIRLVVKGIVLKRQSLLCSLSHSGSRLRPAWFQSFSEKIKNNIKQNKSTKISIKSISDLLTFESYRHILDSRIKYENKFSYF